jgi:CRP-like cAMP-binding protein
MSAKSQTIKDFLGKTPFFGGLDDASMDRICATLTECSFPQRSTVFSQGEQGRAMYVIAKGEIMMCRAGESGHQVKLVRLHPGDFFGETTLIEMQPRPYTAQVVSDATLYELTNVDLYNLYRDDVKAYVMVLQNINRELCRRLRKADSRLTELADSAGDEVTQISSSVRKR